MAASQSPVQDIINTATPSKLQATPNKKLEALQARHAALEATLTGLLTQHASLVAAAVPEAAADPTLTAEERTSKALDNAKTVTKRHITLLHEYNEIKDVAQGLMGLIAEQRGARIIEVQEEFGMDPKD